MNKTVLKFAAGLLAINTCIAVGQTAKQPEQSHSLRKYFKVGHVRGPIDGDGDSIWLSTTKKRDRIYNNAIAIFGYDGSGVINVDGRDIKLRQIEGGLPDKNFKVGQSGHETWKGKNISVRLDYIFTWLCPPQNENCEVYYYKGALDINYRGRHRKIKVVGYGGS
jgi:hypothetical protein